MKIHSSSLTQSKLGLNYFPDTLMNEEHANRIHSQSLTRLNERGGMSYGEIVVNIFGLELNYLNRANTSDKHEKLLKQILECFDL